MCAAILYDLLRFRKKNELALDIIYSRFPTRVLKYQHRDIALNLSAAVQEFVTKKNKTRKENRGQRECVRGMKDERSDNLDDK